MAGVVEHEFIISSETAQSTTKVGFHAAFCRFRVQKQMHLWMWDEIKVSVPGTGIDLPIKGIYEATVKTTEADAKMAEAEWKRVTHEEGSPQFGAMPSVNLRPAGAGVDIVIRYITRAGDRV